MTKEFDERNAAKSRRVCEAMAEAASTGKRVLTERERHILDIWPRFEDGEPVMVGDAVEPPTHGAVSVEAIEFSRGKVCVKDAEDGDWNTSMFAMHPLKRPETKVLDADGVEIKVGDTVWSSMYGDNDFTVSRFSKNCKGETLVMVEEMGSGLFPETVTHTRPDSWERLEEDASKDTCVYFGTKYFNCGECPADRVNCFRHMKSDIVRRAKALAGVEVD